MCLYWKYIASACQLMLLSWLLYLKTKKQIFPEILCSHKGDWIKERARKMMHVILDSGFQKSCNWAHPFISVFLPSATVLLCRIYVVIAIWLPCEDITSNIQLLFQCILNTRHVLQAQNHIVINTSISENKLFLINTA